MSKLRRPIRDPLTEDIERPIDGGGNLLPPNQYFTDDAANDPYFVDDNKDNNFIVVDP